MQHDRVIIINTIIIKQNIPAVHTNKRRKLREGVLCEGIAAVLYLLHLLPRTAQKRLPCGGVAHRGGVFEVGIAQRERVLVRSTFVEQRKLRKIAVNKVDDDALCSELQCKIGGFAGDIGPVGKRCNPFKIGRKYERICHRSVFFIARGVAFFLHHVSKGFFELCFCKALRVVNVCGGE